MSAVELPLRDSALRVAVLGTGIMGGAMATRAAAAGLAVRGWSVPLADAERLVPAGVAVAQTAADAAAGADVVVTMAPDAEAIESFATGPDGFLAVMSPHAVWVQSATVGVAPADRLIALAAEHGVAVVDAPVLGSRGPAERGELVILASGENAAIDHCEPYLHAIARRILRVGPVGSGSRLKMVTNTWIVGAVATLAETMALAEALGLDGQLFTSALDGTELDMGYAHTKVQMMLLREYPAQMTLASIAKDARLAHEAARDGNLPAHLVGAATQLVASALALRGGGEDMAAMFEAARLTTALA